MTSRMFFYNIYELKLVVIVSLFAKETAKYLSGLQNSVTACHLFATHGGEFTLSFLLVIYVKQESFNN